MSARKYMGSVKKHILRHTLQDFPADQDRDVTKYAGDAYRCCVTWFGPPLDPKNSYFVQQAVNGGSSCSRRLGNYCLVVSTSAASPEQLCFHIAHEMYHRVTAGQKGLASKMWVQEMMATLSSDWFLRHQGFSEYAEAVKEDWLNMPEKADVPLLLASRRRSGWDLILRGGEPYSAEFIAGIGRIGYALNRLLNGNDLRRIIRATGLEEWIASLPQEKQYGVCRVLEVEANGKAVPSSESGLDELSDALEAKGDSKIPIAEFKQIVEHQPANAIAFFYLGYAHDGAGEHDAALNAYAQATKLGYTGNWIFYNIGIVYWQMGNFSLAVEWFQKAVEQEPEWAKPRYHLGCSLNKLGNIGAARRVWEEVLTLDDERYGEAARQALHENPLPADVPQE